ncbi:type II toxin-antitoxin system RelE/ParE family toxin [Corynebacterium sp. CCM 9186]|nr:type II toxin-antitoxin system RelE/ParE family toxin [Corynebacterium meridianum]
MWQEKYVRSIDRAVQRKALRKLELTHAAKEVSDLQIPPGNRLERLIGDRRGQYSIRVNAQWRICFIWRKGGADNIELVDNH